MTSAESRVWNAIRGRRLLGLKFRRQHPIRQFVVDFYCAEHRLIIEVEGKIHSTDAGIARDRERTAILQGWGHTVLRLRNEDVEHERLEMLISSITRRSRTTFSPPLP